MLPAALGSGQTHAVRGMGIRAGRLSVHTRPGGGDAKANISEPAGVIRLFRVTAPVGTHVRVSSTIGGIAGVSTSIPALRDDPSDTCTQRDGRVACTQAEEWCPMPAASWRIRVRKYSGPAGWIRITFAVGPLPRSR